MSLHIPIGLNEGIGHVSAIHTEPPVILPRMLVAEMHRNDEPAAAFTSHMPLAISLNILSLKPARSRPPLSGEAGRFGGPEGANLHYSNVRDVIVWTFQLIKSNRQCPEICVGIFS